MPLGEVAYFFQVKLKDPGVHFLKRRLLESLERPPTVEALERAYARTPSIHHRTRLAQGLFDDAQYDAALAHFEGVLAQQPADKAALHGVGCCHMERGEPQQAIAPLQALVDAHPSYRDYEPWAELIEALWQCGQEDEALVLARDLVARAPRLRHIVLEARYLVRAGRKDEARDALRQALDDHRDAARHVRRQNQRYARQAQRMLDELS